MFLEAVRSLFAPRAATTEGGNWDLIDSRTGKLLTAGSETETGIPVNPESALGFHGWFRAMFLIASKSACVPKYLYKPSPDKKGRTIVEETEIGPLIGQQANEEQTAFQFWLQMTGHVASRGNAYAYLYRERKGATPVELIPLDPDRTKPIRKGGKVWYISYPFGDIDPSHPGYKYPAEDVLHFKTWGFDGLIGYPTWQVAANEIGLAKGERMLVSSRFKNSGRPGMILETDKNLTPKAKDRVRDDWERMQGGLNNAGKTAVLDHGLKARPIAMTAEDMQQSEAANMSLIAISNYTGVPVSKLGGARPYATQEQEDRAFVTDGLGFYLDLEDDELTAKLLPMEKRRAGWQVISDGERLIKPDTKTLYEVLRIATAGKPLLSQNEGRERIDMPPKDEEGADELGMPLNVGTGGFKNEDTDPTGDGPGRPGKKGGEQAAQFREAARFAISHATAKMVRRMTCQANEAAEKGSVRFVDFCNNAREKNLSVIKSEFQTAEMVLGAIGIRNSDAANWLYERVMREYMALIDGATEKTVDARTKEVSERLTLSLPQEAVNIYVPYEV